MKKILGYRGTGKTTRVINDANVLHSYGVKVAFITPLLCREKFLREKGLDAGIPIYLVDKATSSVDLKDYILFFDDLEGLFQSMFHCKNICVTVGLEDAVLLTRDRDNNKEE